MSTPQDRKAKARAADTSSGRGANAIIIGGLAIVVIMVLVLVFTIWRATSGGSDSAKGEQKLPTSVESGQPLQPYKDAEPAADAPVVDVYEDFRCPICKAYEGAAGQTITKLAEQGKIKLRVHLMTVIDANTGGHSSAVAGSSAVCALEQDKWTEYHRALFELQPSEENAEGFPESDYTKAAKEAGLSGKGLEKWQQCTDNQTYVDYVKSVDEAATKSGINGTPATKVNGTQLDWTKLTDGQSLESFDTEKFAKILTNGKVPKDMVLQQ